jgi:hypothetical protein
MASKYLFHSRIKVQTRLNKTSFRPVSRQLQDRFRNNLFPTFFAAFLAAFFAAIFDAFLGLLFGALF